MLRLVRFGFKNRDPASSPYACSQNRVFYTLDRILHWNVSYIGTYLFVVVVYCRGERGKSSTRRDASGSDQHAHCRLDRHVHRPLEKLLYSCTALLSLSHQPISLQRNLSMAPKTKTKPVERSRSTLTLDDAPPPAKKPKLSSVRSNNHPAQISTHYMIR